MKVLQVNSSDIIGSRFNGFDVQDLLAEANIESRHLVWNRLSENPSSSRFFDIPGRAGCWIAGTMGDVEILAAAIKRLVETGEERLARGLAVRALAEQLYGDRLFARRLGDLWRSVVARRREPDRSVQTR